MPFIRKLRDRMAACFNGGGQTVQAGTNTDNRTDHIDCGNAAVLSTATHSAFSFACWVKHFDIQAGGIPSINWTIASHWEAGDNLHGRWAIQGAGAAPHQRVFVFLSNGVGSDTAAFTRLGTAQVLAADTDVHIAVTYDGTSCLLYINGVVDAGTPSGAVPAALINTAVHLNLGRQQGHDSTVSSAPMSIHDVLYYGRAISAAEVTALFNHRPIAGTNLLMDLRLNGDYVDQTGLNTITPYAASPNHPAFNFVVPTNRAGQAAAPQVQCFGDSITSGSGWPGGWRINFFDHMWRLWGKPVRIVGQQTDSLQPSYWLDTTHDGVAGEQLAGHDVAGDRQNPAFGIISRVNASIVAHPGTALYVTMGGINDMAHNTGGGALTAAQARDNWIALINQIYASDHTVNGGNYTTPLIVAAPPTYLGGPNGGTPPLVALLPAMVSNMIAGTGGATHPYPNVVYCPDGGYLNNPEDFQADVTHPIRKGYEWMGAAIARVANPLLPDPVVVPGSVRFAATVRTALARMTAKMTRTLTLDGNVAE